MLCKYALCMCMYMYVCPKLISLAKLSGKLTKCTDHITECDLVREMSVNENTWAHVLLHAMHDVCLCCV